MTLSKTRIGLNRWHEQDQRCIWCGEWTWHHKQTTKKNARMVLGIEPGEVCGAKRLRRHKATVEHIIPQSLGGTDGGYNLVCACHYCNVRRGNDMNATAPIPQIAAKLPPNVRIQLVKVGLDLSRWHQPQELAGETQ